MGPVFRDWITSLLKFNFNTSSIAGILQSSSKGSCQVQDNGYYVICFTDFAFDLSCHCCRHVSREVMNFGIAFINCFSIVLLFLCDCCFQSSFVVVSLN